MTARQLAAAAALAGWLTFASGVPVLAASPSPSPSPSAGQPCANPAADPISVAGSLGCDVVTAAGQAGQAVAASVGQTAVSAAEGDFTTWLANGSAWVLEGVIQQVTGTSTTPSLDPAQAAAFARVYGRVVGVALSLSVLLVLIGIFEATLTRRPGALGRVVAGIAVSGIGLGVVPVATALLVRITDDLSSYVEVAPSGIDLPIQMKLLVQTLLAISPNNGAAAVAMAAIGLMVAGVLLWLELVVRASLIYVFLGVAPLACAAVQWPRLEAVLRQVLFAGLALILSKLVIAVVLTTGFAVLTLGNGLQSLLGGMFILLIAALTPFATARLLPLAADELLVSHQGRMRGWMTSSVGTTASIVAAATTGGGAPLGTLAGAAMGLRPSGTGSGPGPADVGSGPGGTPPSGQQTAGQTGHRPAGRQSAAPPAGDGGAQVKRPGPSARRSSGGPQPPGDSGGLRPV